MIKKTLLFILVMFTFFSCSDNIPLNKESIIKYPWLAPFIVIDDNTEVKGYHNFDRSTLDFSYKITNGEYPDILSQFDSIAENEKWEVIKHEKLKREYSKFISVQEGGNVVLKIEIDSIKNRVMFHVK